MSEPIADTIGSAEELPLVQLFMDADPDGHAAAYLSVRWCLSRELITMIRDRGFKQPYLMLTIRHVEATTRYDKPFTRRTDTAHVVVPLEQELAYIAFSRPGTNEVIATVVEPTSTNSIRRLDSWVKHPGGSFDDTIFDEDGAGRYDDFAWIPHIDTHCVQTVEVDKRMFAEPRSGWTKWLVDKFFDTSPKDECHFRRNFLLSLLFAVVALTVGMAIRIIAMAAVLVAGIRQINWRGLDPFEFSEDGWPVDTYEKRTSIWLHNREGKLASWPFLLFNPVTLVIGPAIIWLFVPGMAWWQAQLSLFAGLIALGILVVAFILIFAGIDAIFNKKPSKAQADTGDQKLKKLLGELEAMTCSTAAVNPQLGALPKSKQTIALRFSDLKGRVCKPFVK